MAAVSDCNKNKCFDSCFLELMNWRMRCEPEKSCVTFLWSVIQVYPPSQKVSVGIMSFNKVFWGECYVSLEWNVNISRSSGTNVMGDTGVCSITAVYWGVQLCPKLVEVWARRKTSRTDLEWIVYLCWCCQDVSGSQRPLPPGSLHTL